MNITKLECPNCHAALDNDYGNAGTFFCKYCGQKMIVEELQNAEYDLKIRKMEMDHETTKMAMEQRQQNSMYAYENEKRAMDNKMRLTIILLMVGLLIFIYIFLFAWMLIDKIPSNQESRNHYPKEMEYQANYTINPLKNLHFDHNENDVSS